MGGEMWGSLIAFTRHATQKLEFQVLQFSTLVLNEIQDQLKTALSPFTKR